MSRLKLLIIIPNLGRGGAQRIYHQQLKHLAPYFDVQGTVFNWDGAFDEDKTEATLSLDVPGGRTWAHKIYYFFLRIVRLRKLKREKNIDISISHLEGADYVNILSRRSEKVICWIHGTKKFDKNIKGLSGFIRHHVLMPLIYIRAEKIVTVSRGIQEEFKHNFRGTQSILKTVYNGFDVIKIQQDSLEMAEDTFIKLAESSSIIITHCRLSKQKNLMSLFFIFKRLIKAKSAKLVIIGDGEMRGELINFSRQSGLKTWVCWSNSPLNMTGDVFFLGHQQNPFKYLSKASLYIMTSNWEGFPLALCEAMVCGLPVMASDCYTGPREILASELNSSQPITDPYYGKFGILMPLADCKNELLINVWVDTIKYVMENKVLLNQYSKSGVERIGEFDLNITIRQTVEMIRTV